MTGGIGINQTIEVKDPSGRLILREQSRDIRAHPLYHKLRHQWCNKYRKAWSPGGFREGKYNLKNILFLITRF
jgi:hypothetical protein